MVEQYDRALVFSILDHMDGSYIFSMLFPFLKHSRLCLSHHGQCHLLFNLLNLDTPESKT